MDKKDYALDIKEVLQAIDQNDFEYYDRLSDDQKKALSLWTSMRFASSSQRYPEHYLMMVNTFVNEGFNVLHKHPELQWKLLCLCGSSSRQYHPWIAPPRRKGKNKAQEFLSTIYKYANKDELCILERIHTKEDIIDLAMSTGLTRSEAKKVI